MKKVKLLQSLKLGDKTYGPDSVVEMDDSMADVLFQTGVINYVQDGETKGADPSRDMDVRFRFSRPARWGGRSFSPGETTMMVADAAVRNSDEGWGEVVGATPEWLAKVRGRSEPARRGGTGIHPAYCWALGIMP